MKVHAIPAPGRAMVEALQMAGRWASQDYQGEEEREGRAKRRKSGSVFNGTRYFTWEWLDLLFAAVLINSTPHILYFYFS
jgi:hypothetical protein